MQLPTTRRKKERRQRIKAKSNGGQPVKRKGVVKQVFIVKHKQKPHKRQKLNTTATATLEIKRCQAFIIINHLEKLGNAREKQETELLKALRKLKFKSEE